MYYVSWLQNRFVSSVFRAVRTVRVCAVQNFNKDTIICGNLEGLILEEVKYGIGHSSLESLHTPVSTGFSVASVHITKLIMLIAFSWDN